MRQNAVEAEDAWEAELQAFTASGRTTGQSDSSGQSMISQVVVVNLGVLDCIASCIASLK